MFKNIKMILSSLCILSMTVSVACAGSEAKTAKPEVKEPALWTVIKGDARSYFPTMVITYMTAYRNVATSGIEDPKVVTRAASVSTILLDDVIKQAKSDTCAGSPYFMIDHLEFERFPFGEYNNVFATISGNIICFNFK